MRVNAECCKNIWFRKWRAEFVGIFRHLDDPPGFPGILILATSVFMPRGAFDINDFMVFS